MRWKPVLAAAVLLASALVIRMDGAAHAADPAVTMAPAAPTIGVNGDDQLHLEYDPDGSGPSFPQYRVNDGVTWSSSNTSVATVTNSTNNGGTKGTVTGKAPGTAVISATYSGLTATTTVQVSGSVVSDSFSHGGRIRQYRLYVPSTYNPSVPTSLVLVYHGGNGTANTTETVTQFNKVARLNNFIVAYPQGLGGFFFNYTWNAGECCGYARNQGIDDVGFTSTMIDRIRVTKGYNIDTKRVYATGFSNGALMSHRLACQLSNKIAAIAPVAGGLELGGDFTACNPTRPVSVSAFHGTTDTAVPYNGGYVSTATTTFEPVSSTVSGWLARNGIPASSKVVDYASGIETCDKYTASGNEVQLCRAAPSTPLTDPTDGVVYDGGGHAWPSGVRWAGGDWPTTDVQAANRIWSFFAAHPMP